MQQNCKVTDDNLSTSLSTVISPSLPLSCLFHASAALSESLGAPFNENDASLHHSGILKLTVQ